MVAYHSEVGKRKPNQREGISKASAPAVSVRKVNTVHVLPHQSIVAKVGMPPCDGPLLLEHDSALEEYTGLQLEDTIVHPNIEGSAYVIISNPTG